MFFTRCFYEEGVFGCSGKRFSGPGLPTPRAREMLPDALQLEMEARVTEAVAAFKRKLECFGLTGIVAPARARAVVRKWREGTGSGPTALPPRHVLRVCFWRTHAPTALASSGDCWVWWPGGRRVSPAEMCLFFGMEPACGLARALCDSRTVAPTTAVGLLGRAAPGPVSPRSPIWPRAPAHPPAGRARRIGGPRPARRSPVAAPAREPHPSALHGLIIRCARQPTAVQHC